MALFMAGVPFEDACMGYEGMYASGALTFGTFPALVVPGRGVLNQTQAIARYVGHLTGMYPSEPFLAAKCDEAIDGLTDVSDLVTDTMQELGCQGFKRRSATAFVCYNQYCHR